MFRLVLLALLTPLAWATPPAVNLVVELRWVPEALAPAALGGVRDGAVVVGTAGTVAPQAGLTLGTQAQPVQSVQRLTVLNGASARVQIERSETLQWLDLAAEIHPDTRQPSRLLAVPRSGERRSGQSLVVTPSWPGGAAPVRLSFQAQGEGRQVESTALVPLDVWTAVARLGASPAAPEPGRLSSLDATPTQALALQLRVSRAP